MAYIIFLGLKTYRNHSYLFISELTFPCLDMVGWVAIYCCFSAGMPYCWYCSTFCWRQAGIWCFLYLSRCESSNSACTSKWFSTSRNPFWSTEVPCKECMLTCSLIFLLSYDIWHFLNEIFDRLTQIFGSCITPGTATSLPENAKREWKEAFLVDKFSFLFCGWRNALHVGGNYRVRSYAWSFSLEIKFSSLGGNYRVRVDGHR